METPLPRDLQLAIIKRTDIDTRLGLGIKPRKLRVPVGTVALLKRLPRPRYTDYRIAPPTNPWNIAEEAVVRLGYRYEVFWMKCRQHEDVPDGLSIWGQDVMLVRHGGELLHMESTPLVGGWTTSGAARI